MSLVGVLSWTGHRGLCKFYEVDSLAVATRISHNYQVLSDDGNRIIIPLGNYKFSAGKISDIIHVITVISLIKARAL